MLESRTIVSNLDETDESENDAEHTLVQALSQDLTVNSIIS